MKVRQTAEQASLPRVAFKVRAKLLLLAQDSRRPDIDRRHPRVGSGCQLRAGYVIESNGFAGRKDSSDGKGTIRRTGDVDLLTDLRRGPSATGGRAVRNEERTTLPGDVGGGGAGTDVACG